MAARVLTADPVERAPGNEGGAANFRCVGGSKAVVEEDIVHWLEQRKGAGMRQQVVLTKVLAEDGVATSRHLARLFKSAGRCSTCTRRTCCTATSKRRMCF